MTFTKDGDDKDHNENKKVSQWLEGNKSGGQLERQWCRTQCDYHMEMWQKLIFTVIVKVFDSYTKQHMNLIIFLSILWYE